MAFSSLFLSLSLLLVILVRQHSSSDEVSNTVPAERLIVCTIVDPRSAEIARDVKTLLRSISLFGGSLRKARLVVGWACPRDAPCLMDLSLARELRRYTAEIAIFPETDALTYARTTHKFALFYVLHVHYTLSFDYLLWLDADTLVLRDPLPLLPMHHLPGEIHCVPELFSYLRRYPALFSKFNSDVNSDVNSDESDGNHRGKRGTSSGSSQGSEMFVHPLLSTFVLAGEDERTPHGVCNTGVLLWDTHSLRRALSALPLPLPLSHTHGAEDTHNTHQGTHAAHTVISPRLRRDRFADSLLFVYAVNAQGIDVRALPYSANYMAFMDEEITELTDTHDVSIAHFIAETEFYCVSEVSDVSVRSERTGERERVCRCVYANTRLAADSPLTQRLQEIAQSEHCAALAGDLSLTHSQLHTHPMCELLWPPPHWRFLTHHAHTIHREIHVVVRCAHAALVQVRLDNAAEKSTDTHTHAHTQNDSRTPTELSTVHIAANETSLLSLTHRISQTERSLSQHIFHLSVRYRIACESEPCDDTQEEELHTEIVGVSRSHSARGELRMWRETPLQGHKPITLDTQLHLFSFAHTHSLTHSPHIQNVALFLCCDTVKGVLTTQQFLSEAHAHSYQDTHTETGDDAMLPHYKDGLLHVFVWRLPEALALPHETLAESALRLFNNTCMSPSHASTHSDMNTHRATQPRSRCVLWIADHHRAQESNENTHSNNNHDISTLGDDEEFLQLIDLIPAQSCGIVFIDAYPDPLIATAHSHSSHTSPHTDSHTHSHSRKDNRRRNRSLFQTLFEKTRRGGFLFGSEFALSSHSDSAFSQHAVWENTPRTHTAIRSVKDFDWLRQEMLSFAVQSWALSVRHVLLFTHNEREDEFCADLSLRRCPPAWYIQKV